MSSGTTILEELPTSDNVSAAAKAIVTYIPCYIRHSLHAQGSALENATSNRPTLEYKTAEKVYRINDGGRVLKRSLRQDEYSITGNGEAIVPLLVIERLKNETECIRFIKEHIDIPVPKVLDTYEEHGSYHLWMEFIDGVEMSELTDEEQSKIFPQSKYNLPSLSYRRGLGH
jgi:aminoglycoside phosphotransferase